jgi:hypothetical protein
MRVGCGRIVLLLCCLTMTVGCGSAFGLPTLCEPQSASQKLARAKKFDPYPDPNIGPEMVGARPLGFMNPREEPDVTKQSLPPSLFGYAPPAPPYAPPASYYPSSNVVAPPATAIAPPATVAYPPATIAPSAATRVAPQTLNSAPSSSAATAPLVPLDYSKTPATTPNATDFKTTAWPANSPAPPAYGTKITGP